MGSLPASPMPQIYPPSPTPRIYLSFCGREPAVNTSISNSVYSYTPSNHSWQRLTEIPGLSPNHVLKGFSMVSIGDWLYVIGGRVSVKLPALEPDASPYTERELHVSGRVLRYNTRIDRWFECPSLSIPRFDFACTVNAGKIYVAGGKCGLGSARGISLAEVYDPALDQWKPLPNMTTSRYKCVAVTWKGKLHVVGGFTGRGDKWYTMERSSAEVYDPETDTWNLIVGMWQLDVPPNQIVAVDEKLFSSGDCLNEWKGHIESYDGKVNIWSEVDGSHLEAISSPVSTSACMESNSARGERLYLTMAAIGTQLYFLAGHRMAGEIARMMSVVHVFDTSADGYGWRSFEPIEEEAEKELCSHCCVVTQFP